MFTPQFLLIALSILLIIIFIPALIDTKRFQKATKEITHDKNTVRIIGLIILLFSLFFLSVYWKISKSYLTLISIIGWGALIKGSIFIWFPKTIKKFHKSLYSSEEKIIVWATVALLIAVVSMFIAFNIFGTIELVSG